MILSPPPPQKKMSTPKIYFRIRLYLKKKDLKKFAQKLQKEPVTTCSSKLNTLLLLPE